MSNIALIGVRPVRTGAATSSTGGSITMSILKYTGAGGLISLTAGTSNTLAATGGSVTVTSGSGTRCNFSNGGYWSWF